MAPRISNFCSLVLMLLLLLSLMSSMSSTPTYLSNYCSNDSQFTPNSKYEANLNTLLLSLSSNAAATTNNGFFSSSAGSTATTDAVYGLYLCRGDQNATSCSNCVTTATTTAGLKKHCPLGKSAIIWYDECMVRYSDESLAGSMQISPTGSVWGPRNVSVNQPLLASVLEDLMANLTSEAVANIKSSEKMFATGEQSWEASGKLYGLCQCTPDLSPSVCSQCLNVAIGSLPVAFGEAALSGKALLPSCSAQYATYRFFNLPPISNNSTDSNRREKGRSSKVIMIAIVVSVLVVLVAALNICICLIKRKKSKKYEGFSIESGEELNTTKFLQYHFDTLKHATNNFSQENKLGEGGFGGVYKGVLRNGQEIAVKRLSRSSTQGVKEFKNEVLVVGKLQHKNLVRLLGFCVEGKEKLLVYEFVPNKSLNYFLFDANKQGALDWKMRYKIVQGIAQGILYLHQDARPRIIHRDLKASNVLLDIVMNPKVSDFGMARIFGIDEQQANTSRIVGTYGYMAPEYALRGQFSVKTDVYSFGVLVLEIISGKQNNKFSISDYDECFLGYAWTKWKDEKPLEFMDPAIRDSCSSDEVMKCIQLGLLCVQNSPVKRPTMATIVSQLNSSSSEKLPMPEKPVFYARNLLEEVNFSNECRSDQPMIQSVSHSMNIISITEAGPR